MWTLDLEHIADWLMTLDQKSYELVIAAITLLKDKGPTLGRPIVDHVEDSAYQNMKELRPGSSGKSELRVLFAFDPERRGIMLVAGDKSGNWKKWYKENIPIADARFKAHLDKLNKKNKKTEGK